VADQARILVVGSTMIDLIAYADRLPGDGETVVGRRFQTGFGGKGANQAVVAARFGASVAIVNAVGDDDYGTGTLANFTAQGVATDYVVRVAGSSGVAPIWVDASGTNRIIVVPGANLHVPSDLAVRAVAEFRPSVVIGQFEIPQPVTASAFTAARAIGATTILNPAPAAAIDESLLAVTDWLVPNETEFAVVAGEPLPGDPVDEAARIRAFARQVGVSLAVTLGKRGAALVPTKGELVRVAAPAVTPVDTTGAGDAFVGAFGVGLALGWDPEAAARLGCTAASDSTTRPGTQRSYPDRRGAAALLASVDPSRWRKRDGAARGAG
jgi:ribokinase